MYDKKEIIDSVLEEKARKMVGPRGFEPRTAPL